MHRNVPHIKCLEIIFLLAVKYFKPSKIKRNQTAKEGSPEAPALPEGSAGSSISRGPT